MTCVPHETDENVLSTMRADGSRRWMTPRLAKGRLWRARRWLAWGLIVLYVALPHLSIGGKPAVLLDLPARAFTVLGFTFLPTDTVLLALALVTLILGICLATALAGRVWCGWMCPQTVYLEFVYRPLERLFDGPPGGKPKSRTRALAARTALATIGKYAVYLAVSALLAHTFLAYFAGAKNVTSWVTGSPLEHPIGFAVVVIVTGLMLFDFSYFREQMCIVACPYGRFQSVMLDRDSLIVSYDRRRGEPRGKGSGTRGDCIDCGMCEATCPTGIDIRDGLQMECIACTQCIDTCNGVMDRLKRPRGLIRFSSQSRIEGNGGRLIRPRVIVYPTIMLVLVGAFVTLMARKQSADVTLLRGMGMPYYELAPGQITNQVRVKITNRGDAKATYQIEVVEPTSAAIDRKGSSIDVLPGESRTDPVLIAVPAAAFQGGRYDVRLRISDGGRFSRELGYRLLGPQDAAKSPEVRP